MSPAGSSNAPEARARARIDQALAETGWTLQDRDDMNPAAAPAIAVREFKLDKGHGYVDYMLFLDGHPVGVARRSRRARPHWRRAPGEELRPGHSTCPRGALQALPFAYLSTGEETLFINHDPHAHAPGAHSIVLTRCANGSRPTRLTPGSNSPAAFTRPPTTRNHRH